MVDDREFNDRVMFTAAERQAAQGKSDGSANRSGRSPEADSLA